MERDLLWWEMALEYYSQGKLTDAELRQNVADCAGVPESVRKCLWNTTTIMNKKPTQEYEVLEKSSITNCVFVYFCMLAQFCIRCL